MVAANRFPFIVHFVDTKDIPCSRMSGSSSQTNSSVYGAKSLMRTVRTLLPVFLFSAWLFSQTMPSHGIDVTDLDRKTDPCADFAQFSNGSLHARNPIPASMKPLRKRLQAGGTAKGPAKPISGAVRPAS